MAQQKHNVNVVIKAKDLASKKFRFISRGANSLGRSFKKLALAGSVTLAAGAVGIAKGTQELVQAASKAEEIESKFDAVFKAEAAAAREFGTQLAKNVNRSRFEMQKYLSTLQDTFVPLGFARDQARSMSQTMTELAVDLASFNNTADSDAIRDLQSAIVGNHETMRKYGVIITQAVLDQELLNMGFKGGAKNASEQMKAQARLNVIMEGTADAQGDAARTAGSFANQWRGLKSQIFDSAAIIGKSLLPTISSMAANTREWVKKSTPLIAEWARKAVAGAGLVKDVFVDFIKFMKEDWQSGIGFVFDSFIYSMEAAFKSAVLLAIAGGKGIWKGAKTGIMGGEDKIIENTARERYVKAGGEYDFKKDVNGHWSTANHNVPRNKKLWGKILAETEAEHQAQKVDSILGNTMDTVKSYVKDARDKIAADMPEGLAEKVAKSTEKFNTRLAALTADAESGNYADGGGKPAAPKFDKWRDETVKALKEIARNTNPKARERRFTAPGVAVTPYSEPGESPKSRFRERVESRKEVRRRAFRLKQNWRKEGLLDNPKHMSKGNKVEAKLDKLISLMSEQVQHSRSANVMGNNSLSIGSIS